MLGPEEAPAEIVDRFTCKARQFSRPFPVCVQEVSHDAQRAGCLAVLIGVPARRPEEHDRADPRAGGEAPTLEAVGNRGVWRRNRHRQHECEERSGRSRREVAADHAREQSREADRCHRTRAEPCVSGAESPEGDERRADAPQADVCEQATPPRPSELDQYEHRERSEGREDRRLRLRYHPVREREHRGHDDRRARGALQRCQIGHGFR